MNSDKAVFERDIVGQSGKKKSQRPPKAQRDKSYKFYDNCFLQNLILFAGSFLPRRQATQYEFAEWFNGGNDPQRYAQQINYIQNFRKFLKARAIFFG